MDILDEPVVPHVSSQQVKHALDTHEPVILLDVRTPGEYARGRIEGSINIPLDRIECDAPTLLPDPLATIYVYCLSGSRSIHAVVALKQMGYANVFDMTQGLLAWRAHSFPVAT